ncbi:MAG TPA: hypothetical protein VIV12_26270 [Streptosporangiaceae bacterium]
MRPALKPGLIPVWRNRDTVQIGIDPRRAIALTGMRGAADLLALLDGSRDHAQVLAAAADLGIEPTAADHVITLLAAGGALHDFPASAYQDLPAELRIRLAPELATAAVAHGDGDGGARTLARRRAARVRVHSASRAGAQVASLLSAAGIGLVVSTGLVLPPETAPTQAESNGAELLTPEPGAASGLAPLTADSVAARATTAEPATAGAATAGTETSSAATADAANAASVRGSRRRHRRVTPQARPQRRHDLVVLVDSHRRELPAALVQHQVPHLAVSAIEAIGVVGPLVVPGWSACLRCLDLARAERDPAWPLILAQLADHPAGPLGCDAVLATAVSAQAAAQALAFIDRGARAVAAANGTLELVLPDWQWRRRTWQAHPRCECGTHSS